LHSWHATNCVHGGWHARVGAV